MLVSYIHNLLQKHSCVIVPGFGAFLANYKPAHMDWKENTISPPSKSIAFNKSLTSNDGLLASYLCEKENITYPIALQKIASEVQAWESSIQQNKSLLLKDIGRFIIDEHQHLLFTPFQTVNYLADSFGFSPIQIEPIKRLKDAALVNEELKKTKKKFRFPFLNTLIAICVLTFVGLTLAVNMSQSGYQNVSWASLFPFNQNSTTEKTIENETLQPKKKEVVVVPPKYVVVDDVKYPTAVAKDETLVEKSTNNASTTLHTEIPSKDSKVYVSIGAYFSQEASDDIRNKAEAEGFKVKTLKSNKLFKILIELDQQDLSKKMPLIKSEVNANAWVFCSDCKVP